MAVAGADQNLPKHLTRGDLKRIGLSCININLSRASRIVTRLYDEVFEPLGLTSSQFSLLVAVALYENETISALADILSKERTTLTRNLQPMEKEKGWLLVERGADARSRTVRLTAAGRDLLVRAVPLREQAHQKLLAVLGAEDWDRTRHTLARLYRSTGVR